MKYLNILFPVYNEEMRLENGIRKTIQYMDHIFLGNYVLTIVDNASVDKTMEISRALCDEFEQVKYLRLEEKGVGVAFRRGVAENESSIVGYMDVDLSTDLKHLQQVIDIFRKNTMVDMVNGSRWNRNSDTRGRKWYRSITSNGLTVLLKIILGLKATDSICGFKFFRKESAERLIHEAGEDENGWFYIIELLLRAERNNMKIVELPVHWEDDYNTTVKVFALIKNYCIQIIRLRKKFINESRGK